MNLETHTLLRGKALADYQGRYKLEVNRAGASMYGTTVAELSILHSALSEIVSLVLLSVAFFFHSSPTTESLEKVSYVFVDFIYNHTH